MKRIRSWVLAGVLLLSAVLVGIAGNYKGWFNGPVVGQGQPDGGAEYRKIGERFLQDSALSLAGAILLYDGEEPGRIKEQNSFRLIRESGNMYNRLGYIQTFSSEGWMVQLDTINQVLIVADAPVQQEGKAGPFQQSTGLMFNDTTAFTTIGTVTGDQTERTLSLRSDLHPEIRLYRLTYDPATYRMKRAVIEWWKDAVVSDTTKASRVWITKIDYQYEAVPAMKVRELIDQVITRDRDGIHPTERYKDYQLHIVKP